MDPDSDKVDVAWNDIQGAWRAKADAISGENVQLDWPQLEQNNDDR